ncbi:MAG: isocitrate/isopropylmalate family dehydrogenase [Myxococcota bacterium]
MTRKRVVVIEGEDAAPEAMRPCVALLESWIPDIEWIHPAVGERGKQAHGSLFPTEAREAIDASDATLFGSTSGPSAPALMYLRWGRQTYANVRPARYRTGYRSPLARPEDVDLVIVRENLEDMYMGIEGDIEALAGLNLQSRTARRPLSDFEPGRYALKLITERGTERVARYSFELARKRRERGRPGRLTCGSKHNMLPYSDGYFRDVTERVAADYPDVEYNCLIVDDLAHKLVIAPDAFDVIVLPNLYGDILSDAAAGLIGGLGLAASGCYGADYAYFESAHGTAPDIAGKNIINPTATLLSAAMMLEYLDFATESHRLESSLASVYEQGGVLTPDQGGSATTTEFCDAVAAEFDRISS